MEQVLNMLALQSRQVSTHMGHASIQGKTDDAIAHKMKVSGLSRAEVDQEIEAAFKLCEQLNRGSWKLDIGILMNSEVRAIRKE